jgi:transposase
MQSSFEELAGEIEEVSPARKAHARIGKTSFRQPVDHGSLLPESIESHIPKGHLTRSIAGAISQMDLSPLWAQYSHLGGAPYPAERLLAVVIYGMTEGVRSSRQLEQHCQFDLRYRYLMGGLEPDDRTFLRFLERVDPVIEELFRAVYSLLGSKNLVKAQEVVVDGVKSASSSSSWKYREGSPLPDPEASVMHSHGRYLVGYNAQFAVDTQNHIIVGVEVLCEQNDFHAVAPVLEAIKRQTGETPCVLIGDSGFDSCRNIEALESRGVDSVIAAAKPLPENVSEDAEGVLRCAVGREIVLSGHRTFRDVVHNVYRPKGGCKGCPLQSACDFFRKYLQVPPQSDVGARFRNRARVRSGAYSGAMIRRRSIERVFGIRNACHRFGKILRRGRQKARTEMLLWAIAYNIGRLIRLESDGRLFFAILVVVFAKIEASCRSIFGDFQTAAIRTPNIDKQLFLANC